MSKFLEAARKRSERAQATMTSLDAQGDQADSQATVPATPRELQRKNATSLRGSNSGGSQVDLVTPPPKLSRRGSGDSSRGKGTQKQPSGYFPDNQLGLEDSPPGVFSPVPSTQPYQPEAEKPEKPKTPKHTAAKSQPKPRAPASVHKRVRGKMSPVHGPTGESNQTKPVHNEHTADKDGQETQRAKKTPQKKPTVKKHKGSKEKNKAAVKAKTSKGHKEASKGAKGPAAKEKTSKGAETSKPVIEYDGSRVKNPGGRASSSGMNKKRQTDDKTPDTQTEKPAAKIRKISDSNSNKVPSAPAELKENDEAAVVAALQRADTREQKELEEAKQEKLAKRKAYKARKQRFYNSLSSSRTPSALRKKAEESRGSLEDMQKLYEEWLAANECWSASTYVIQLQQTSKFTKTGARRWMTYSQICEKYKSEDVATCIIEEKKKNPVLAETQIKPHPDCPNREDMALYLVWDSESETSKDCTMLTTGMSATDANDGDDDESPKPKRKKPKRSSTESDSETDESAESESEEEASKSKEKKGKDKKDKKSKKDRDGRGKTRKRGKGRKAKKKTLTEEQKKKNEEREKQKAEKKAETEKQRAAERAAKKAYSEKVGESRKVMNQLTNKIADVRSRMSRAKQLNAALSKAICSQLEHQREALQQSRDALQSLVDNFEEKKAKTVTAAGEKALSDYKKVLESMKI